MFGPDKLAGGNCFDNRFVDHADAELDADIERVERDPLAAVELRGYSDVTGAVGDSKVLVIHTSRDELVRSQQMSVLPELGIPPEQLASAIVAEDSVGHCEFDGLEVVAGLRVAGGLGRRRAGTRRGGACWLPARFGRRAGRGG